MRISSWLTIPLSCSIFSLTSSSTLDCSYEYWSFDVVGSTYHCEIQTDPRITTPESAVIEGADGPHHGPKTDDDVAGFYVNNRNMKINFFPLGLEKIYKNLKLVFIQHNGIKKVHQSDFRDLTKLEYLSLTDGLIQVLEEGLFDFNLDLLYISFEDNRISQIHPEVFSQLTMLTQLSLGGNRCKFRNAKNSTEVQKVITEIRMSCPIGQAAIEESAQQYEVLDNKDVNSSAGTSRGCPSVPQSFFIVITVTVLYFLGC